MAEDDKYRKYGAIADQTPLHFTPLACESLGRWSPATEEFLHKLARGVRAAHYKDDPQMTVGHIVNRWWAMLSVSLARHNARMVFARTNPDKKTDVTRPSPADKSGAGALSTTTKRDDT